MTRLTGENQEERTQQKASHIIQPGLTNEHPTYRDEDLRPSAKRVTDRTEALGTLSWYSEAVLQQNVT